MPASPSSKAEELTASSLEALSLSDIVPLPPPSEPQPPPTTALESLPANIPLPPPPNARATHAHHLLRHVMTTLHTALHPPHLHLSSSLSAITALALSTPVYRRLLAHLGVVRLLPSAFATHAETGTQFAPGLIEALAACLTGGDALAVEHFSASKATSHLLAGWKALEQPSSAVIAALSRSLVAALPSLQSSSLDLLATGETLGLLRDALGEAISNADARVAAPILEALSRLLEYSDDGLLQAKVREIGLLELAVETLNVAGKVRNSSLRFLRNAVEDNVQNVVAIGAAGDGRALRCLIRCAKEGGDNQAIIDLATELCKVRKHFDTLLSLGLSGAIIESLEKGVTSPSHIVRGLELLERGVKNNDAEGRKCYARSAASIVVNCMQSFRNEPEVEVACIRLLVGLMESFAANAEAACDAFAVQAVQLAMTEHSREAEVVHASCAFFLHLSPLQIMRSQLVMTELKKVIRARLKIHRDADIVSVAETVCKALDMVPPDTIKSIDEFLNGNVDNSALAVSPRKKPLSFRKSFHKAVREGKRRVRSDFTAETGTRGLDESQRLRGSRALEKERKPWNEFGDCGTSKSPNDSRACEPLMYFLGRDEESSSQSSSRSARVGGSLSMTGLKKSGESPVVVRRVKSDVDKRGMPISFSRKKKADVNSMAVEAMDSEGGEDSMSSLSDSDVDSVDDDVFEKEEQVKERLRNEKPLLSDLGCSNEQLMFEVDENFPDLDEATTDSAGSQNVISMVTDVSNANSLAGSDLVPKAKKYGERERSRSDGLRNSGNWGSMKAWQFAAMAEEVRVGGGGMTRGESGSLGSLR